MKLNNLKLRTRIYALVVILLLTTAGLNSFNILSIQKVARDGKNVYQRNFVGLRDISAAKATAYAMAATIYEHLTTENMESKGTSEQKFNKLREDLEGQLSSYETHMSLPREIELMKQIREAYEEYFSKSPYIFELSRALQSEEALVTAKEIANLRYEKIQPAIEELITINQTSAEEQNKTNSKIALAAQNNSTIAMIVATLFGGFMAWFISRSITKPVQQVSTVLNSLAIGDLTNKTSYESQDELGLMAVALNQAIDNLRDLVKHVVDSAEQVASSSQDLSMSAQTVGEGTKQVSEAMNQLAKGSDDQGLAASNTGVVVGKMTQAIQQVGYSTQVMAEDADGASKIAQNGQKAVNEAILQISSVKGTINESTSLVQILGERSKEIGRILEVIANIAKQTNLLALNAAIEAARAGVHGSGFAVVADEVRTLAEQSRVATDQISELIRAIQTETAKAVEAMEKGSNEIAAGVQVVNLSGESFSAIVQAVESVTGKIQDVVAATKELTTGSEQVVSAVENIASITEEAAASTEEVSATTEEQMASVEQIATSAEGLAQQAKVLQQIVRRFKLV